ncbi:MAG: lysophospholipase [Gammaproteobacteria bacterium]|nr:lysophospholipase [Gammaproteobacteria bacterium]
MATLQWLGTASDGAPRDFRIGRGNARPVTGALWLPPNPDAETPLLLCGHGASGDRYQAPIPYLGKRMTREQGVAVLAIDGPVHGLRHVPPGGREALRVEMQREGAVEDMVGDWHEALEAVCRDTGVGPGRIAYFGLSMGSIFGIPLLASGIGVHAATLGLLGTWGLGRAFGERLARDAAAIDIPVLFLMQLEDELFNRKGYLELFDALGSADKRLHANPGLHPEIPAEEIDFAFEFLARRLAGEVRRGIVNPLAE